MYLAFISLASTQQESFCPNALIHPVSQIRSLKNHWTCVQMCHKADLPSTIQEIRTIDEHSKLQEGSRQHEEKKFRQTWFKNTWLHLLKLTPKEKKKVINIPNKFLWELFIH